MSKQTNSRHLSNYAPLIPALTSNYSPLHLQETLQSRKVMKTACLWIQTLKPVTLKLDDYQLCFQALKIYR